MFSVLMERECGCFKRSEYESEKRFERQHEAYNYANILAELMNEEFCKKHLFIAQKTVDDNFVIRVMDNGEDGSCSTGGCGTSCGC